MLIATSLSQAMVKNDDAGNFRLVKRSTNIHCARDDVAAASDPGGWPMGAQADATHETSERRTGRVNGVVVLKERYQRRGMAAKFAIARCWSVTGWKCTNLRASTGGLRVDHLTPLIHGGARMDMENLAANVSAMPFCQDQSRYGTTTQRQGRS